MGGQIKRPAWPNYMTGGIVTLALLLGLVGCSQPPTPTPTPSVAVSPTPNDLLPPMPPGFDGPLPAGVTATPASTP